jgi:hypothetical protein
VTGRGGVSRRPFDRRKIRTLRCDQWQAGENGMRSESATTITRARQRDLPPPMSPPELRAREGDNSGGLVIWTQFCDPDALRGQIARAAFSETLPAPLVDLADLSARVADSARPRDRQRRRATDPIGQIFTAWCASGGLG